MAGPGSPPGSSASPLQGHLPPVPTSRPARGRELLLGQAGDPGAAQVGGSQPAWGHGGAVGEGLPRGRAPWRPSAQGCVCSRQGQCWGWGGLGAPCGSGGTPGAAEGLALMTGNLWAQRGWWGRDGLWGRAGARRGDGSGHGWPGLGLGEMGCPGCGEHPVVLGAALQGHWESPAEGCGDRAVGWGCVGPLGWGTSSTAVLGGCPRSAEVAGAELGWDARALAPRPGSGGSGWAQPLAFGSRCTLTAPPVPGVPCTPTAKLCGSIPLRCGASRA